MTVLTIPQVAGWWEREGGPSSRTVEFVAIAIAESSLDTAAVSVTDAIGLWQEEPDHAGEYGYPVSALYDPQVNAFIAVRLSGFGSNCAAWDTAYRNIYASGRYGFLGYPEQGSAAWNNLATVANVLGRSAIPAAQLPPMPGISTDLPGAVSRWQDVAGRQLPGLSRALLAQRARLNRLYTG